MFKIKKKKGIWDLQNSTKLDDISYYLYCNETEIKQEDIIYTNNGYAVIIESQENFVNYYNKQIYYDKAKIILRKDKLKKLKKKKRWTLLQWIK